VIFQGEGDAMRIGELCAKTGLSKETVRYYERQGLLENIPQPNRSNNYKVYSAVDLQRLNMIKHAKMLGFTLAEIAEVLAVWVDDNFTAEQNRLSAPQAAAA
jgi:MerR family Zn(II)-responsive transcriptional regulator of zntA